MKLEKAQSLATLWMNRLSPFCDRIAIAGSIRRGMPEVKDIEIVCIPKVSVCMGLFGPTTVTRDPGFINALRLIDGELDCLIGDAEKGKYFKMYLPIHDINMDIFTAKADNWGYILAVRTGSATYSHKVLARTWVSKGYHGDDGFLRGPEGDVVPVREEEDLFRLLGLKYVEPQHRHHP